MLPAYAIPAGEQVQRSRPQLDRSVGPTMTRPSPSSTPEDLFEAIAGLLEPSQREYFYQRMLYFRHLRPEDELLRLVEAIGLLALLIREAPHAVVREREQMAQLLETSLATIHAAGEAGRTLSVSTPTPARICAEESSNCFRHTWSMKTINAAPSTDPAFDRIHCTTMSPPSRPRRKAR
jgi:hypothetical protein